MRFSTSSFVALLIVLLGARPVLAIEPVDAFLPELDLSSGEVPSALEVRQQQIEAEIAELGSGHPWAGRYAFGDGLGVNQELLIAPVGGFVVTWHGCLGLYGANEGRVRINADGDLELQYEWLNREGEFGQFPTRLRPVTWGAQHLLIPPEQLLSFVSEVNHNGVRAAKGLNFRRAGDDDEVTGFPKIGDDLMHQLRREPLTLEVVAARSLTANELSWGACAIRRTLWFDSASSAELASGLELEPVDKLGAYGRVALGESESLGRAASWQTIVDEDCQPDPNEQIPDVGSRYTTGAFSPETDGVR
ncbi:MAG: hypothetical protein KDI51_13450 [Xanthomonadales bacterium]|nr:hypothetical protein [Xanthomonadales bacterium]